MRELVQLKMLHNLQSLLKRQNIHTHVSFAEVLGLPWCGHSRGRSGVISASHRNEVHELYNIMCSTHIDQQIP